MSGISFSISADEGRPKVEAWRHTLRQAFGPIEVGLNSREDFSGFVRTYKRQELQFNEICYRGQTLERTAQNLAGFDQEYFTFSRTVSGPLHFEQNGWQSIVNPGSLVLLNQTSPYKAFTNACYHAFSVSIPKKLLLQRAPQIGAFYKMDAVHGSPRGQLLANFVQHLNEGISGWTESEFMALREQLLDLIVLLMVNDKSEFQSSEESSVKAAHRERAMAYIKYNHRNAQMNPQLIAAACGISVGYLHKIFQAVNLRVEHSLYSQRLETCKSLLLNPQYRHCSVQQIAYESGFNHPSHCSRVFKEKFGVSPSDFRAAHKEATQD
jgi:AraC-like DNA-binding protein